MSLLRYPLVVALLGLFLGTLVSSSTAGSDAPDSAPSSTESRKAKDSERRDQDAPAATPTADACAQ